MSKIYILCVEDEPEVLDALMQDLSSLEEVFPVDTARSTAEARRALRRIREEGNQVGLILCDHSLPGEQGADFLAGLQRAAETAAARKMLLADPSDLASAVKVLDQAKLNFHIAKPWRRAELLEAAKQRLTDFVLECEENFLPYFGVLDGARLANAMRIRGTAREE